jgi:hypothetical protein
MRSRPIVRAAVIVVMRAVVVFHLGSRFRALLHRQFAAAKIGFAGLVLAAQAFGFSRGPGLVFVIAAITTLTLASTAVYLAQWLRHTSG